MLEQGYLNISLIKKPRTNQRFFNLMFVKQMELNSTQ